MTVGFPNKPEIAGNGGLARTMPRLPSRLSSKDVVRHELVTRIVDAYEKAGQK